MLHCHGTDIRKITPFTRPMVERALRGAAHVYYATPDLADFVCKRRPDARFLPNPVDATTFAPRSPSGESTSVFICCALTEIKGARRLLQACRRLAAERPDITVTALAGGHYAADFASLPNVRMIPRQKRHDLPAIISQHGVVMGQALVGAVGMSELESMACSRPVVAWYRFKHAYPEPPPIIRAVDGWDIAENVMRLVDDAEARQRVGDESRAWVRRYHDVDAIAAQVEESALDLARWSRAQAS